MERSLRGVQPGPNSVGGMASRNPLNREGNNNGHIYRWHGADRGVGGLDAVETEASEISQGDDDPGERWFHQENSRAEI